MQQQGRARRRARGRGPAEDLWSHCQHRLVAAVVTRMHRSARHPAARRSSLSRAAAARAAVGAGRRARRPAAGPGRRGPAPARGRAGLDPVQQRLVRHVRATGHRAPGAEGHALAQAVAASDQGSAPALPRRSPPGRPPPPALAPDRRSQPPRLDGAEGDHPARDHPVLGLVTCSVSLPPPRATSSARSSDKGAAERIVAFGCRGRAVGVRDREPGEPVSAEPGARTAPVPEVIRQAGATGPQPGDPVRVGERNDESDGDVVGHPPHPAGRRRGPRASRPDLPARRSSQDHRDGRRAAYGAEVGAGACTSSARTSTISAARRGADDRGAVEQRPGEPRVGSHAAIARPRSVTEPSSVTAPEPGQGRRAAAIAAAGGWSISAGPPGRGCPGRDLERERREIRRRDLRFGVGGQVGVGGLRPASVDRARCLPAGAPGALARRPRG